jgi:hypothetical protein
MIIDHLFTRTLFESQTDPITQFASNAHEEWRRNFDPTGTKPRIKKNSDGTEGDINVPFADLHPDWQKENLAAAHAAHRAVKHFGRDMEKAAEYVHNEWMKRNPKADYNAAQHVPYDDLPEDEKEKDRVHVRTMMQLMGHRPEQGVAEGSINEFAQGSGGGESGRWYTDDEMTDIVGDGWWQDMDVSGANIGVIDSEVPKEYMIQQAQAWLDDQGYSVQVLNCRMNDDDMDWYIEGSFQNSSFAKKGVAESNTLMIKLKQALLKEGRVKELADDLKTLNDAEFMKKYGKAKAAIRKDMKKVDEGNANSGRRGPNSPPDNSPVKLGPVQKLKTGIKHHADSSRYGGSVPDEKDDHLLSPAARHRLHKAVTPDQQDLDEGNMPQSVVKSKQKYADMSDQEFHAAHKNKSEDDLRSMAWRHGYGKNSNHYVNRHKKGGGQLNELSTNKLAQYKTAAAADAKRADQAGDFKRGDKRLSGMVQATKKQFDNDAKKVDEGRQARRSLMARIANSR